MLEFFDSEIDGETGRPVICAPPRIVQPRQIWALGRHRLLCGDTSVNANRAAVFGPEPAGTVVVHELNIAHQTTLRNRKNSNE